MPSVSIQAKQCELPGHQHADDPGVEDQFGTPYEVNPSTGRPIVPDLQPKHCVVLDMDVCRFVRSVQINGGLKTSPSKLYDLRDFGDVAQLDTDLRALYPAIFDSATSSGDKVTIKVAVGQKAVPLIYECFNLYCAPFPRLCLVGELGTVQLQVDSVDGPIIDVSAMTTEAEILAAIKLAYPEIKAQSFMAGMDGGSPVWLLETASDNQSDHVTDGAVLCEVTVTITSFSVDSAADTATATFAVYNPGGLPLYFGAFALGDEAVESGTAATAGTHVFDFAGAAIPIEAGTVVTIGVYPQVETGGTGPTAPNYAQEQLTAT